MRNKLSSVDLIALALLEQKKQRRREYQRRYRARKMEKAADYNTGADRDDREATDRIEKEM